MRWVSWLLSVAVVMTAGATFGQENPFPSGSRLTQPEDPRLEAPNAVPQHLDYGRSRWQEIYFYPGAGSSPTPLVVSFSNYQVSGWMRYRLNRAGIALAVLRNRPGEPQVTKTIGSYLEALAYLHREADNLGVDRRRLALFGYGNGGSLATLFGTDPSLFARAGIPFDYLRGVISIGGEDFDVPRRMSESAYLRSLYRRYYSSDENELENLSPVSHVLAPNAPAFLLLAVEKDEDGIEQSQMMARVLTEAGTQAEYVTLPEWRQDYAPSYFMAQEDGSGREVIPFLRAALALAD